MALYGLQKSRQINKALFLQAGWFTEIEGNLRIIMASIERSKRIRTRTRLLKMKAHPSSEAIEVERIITRDGFSYFPVANVV